MLYLATASEQPTYETSDLNIEPVLPERSAVQQVFTLPFVRFVGAHTGCSCGFPSIRAEQPVEYSDDMFGPATERVDDLESVGALLAIVRQHVAVSGSAELYAVWQGDEKRAAKGSITARVGELEAERFFFIERFLYQILR